MPIRVTVDATEAIKGLSTLQRSSLPFALAKSLTATALDGQAAVRGQLPQRFTLRNRFFDQGIRIKPADKKGPERIEADVHTYLANQKSDAPDFAGRQEDGGERVPANGHQHLAIPTQYLRQMAPGIIPDELRAKNLLSLQLTGNYIPRRRGKREGPVKPQPAKLVRGMVFFLQILKGGRLAIMGRYFTEEDAYPFYLLIPSANVRGRLGMEETVRSAVEANFQKRWAETWRGIMVRGLRVRF